MARAETLEMEERQESQRRARKALWKGFVTIAFVSIPVSLYPLYLERGIHFNLLCGKCLTPLRNKRWCEKCEREVPWEEVVKGYRIARNEYVVIKKEDLEKLPLKSAKSIEILQFVASYTLDPIYFDRSYYLLPEKGGERAFFIFLEVMEEMERAAIGKFTFRNREELVLLRPHKGGLILTVLHYPEEIVNIEKIPELAQTVKIEKEERRLARELVDGLTKEFDLSNYKDEYLEAFRQLIEHKVAGKEIAKPPEVKKVKSLMEALKRSVEKIDEGQSD